MLHYLSFTTQNSCSPLYVACEYGCTEVVDVLLNAGADVHQACKVMRTLKCDTLMC